MRKYLTAMSLAVMAAFGTTAGAAVVLTEDFEAALPAWESNWFGTNTNAQNYYCLITTCSDRGNNPDGLWLATGATSAPIDLVFDTTFGQRLTSFSFDVVSYVPGSVLTAFDSDGVQIFLQTMALFPGQSADSDPGVYQRISFTSGNGIGGFSFSGEASGNTSIDNLNAVLADPTDPGNQVPEPGSLALLGLGLVGLAAGRRRKNG